MFRFRLEVLVNHEIVLRAAIVMCMCGFLKQLAHLLSGPRQRLQGAKGRSFNERRAFQTFSLRLRYACKLVTERRLMLLVQNILVDGREEIISLRPVVDLLWCLQQLTVHVCLEDGLPAHDVFRLAEPWLRGHRSLRSYNAAAHTPAESKRARLLMLIRLLGFLRLEGCGVLVVGVELADDFLVCRPLWMQRGNNILHTQVAIVVVLING